MTIINMGRKGVYAISMAVAVALLAGCETTALSKPVAFDVTATPDADFSPYKTYYVLEVPPGENEVAPPKPFSRIVVEAAVREQFGTRNYRETANKDAADVHVAIQFSLEDETVYKEKTVYDSQIATYSGGYRSGYGSGYGRGYSGYGSGYRGYSYGYGYRDYYGYTSTPRTTIVAENFRQGNMLIDVIDRKSNAVVWEAHAAGEGETEAAKIEARVNAVVSRLFEQYPHVAPPPLSIAP